jgi:hypothetical protein
VRIKTTFHTLPTYRKMPSCLIKLGQLCVPILLNLVHDWKPRLNDDVSVCSRLRCIRREYGVCLGSAQQGNRRLQSAVILFVGGYV